MREIHREQRPPPVRRQERPHQGSGVMTAAGEDQSSLWSGRASWDGDTGTILVDGGAGGRVFCSGNPPKSKSQQERGVLQAEHGGQCSWGLRAAIHPNACSELMSPSLSSCFHES